MKAKRYTTEHQEAHNCIQSYVKTMSSSRKSEVVRAARIELASQAWEAHILPMYYARFYLYLVKKL